MQKKTLIDTDTYRKNNPIVFLIVLGVLTGFILFDHYGASWDEPELYEYAEQSVGAYSIRDRIEGRFDLSKLMGPDNLRYYGPVYLVFSKLIITILHPFFEKTMEIDLWHLLNFYMYAGGSIVFYKLLTRWFKPESAMVTTLLFSTQPVIFGMAWINPKDIPFMSLFICSIYTGLVMVDKLSLLMINNEFPEGELRVQRFASHSTIVFVQKLTLIVSFIAGLSFILRTRIESWIFNFVVGMSERRTDDVIYQLFLRVARNANSVPLEAYGMKAVENFRSGLTIVVFCAGIAILFFISLKYNPGWFYRLVDNCKFAIAIIQKKKAIKETLHLIFASCFLGFSTSIRVLAPLAGLLVSLELLRKLRWKSIFIIISYIIWVMFFLFVSWPYLWEDTLPKLFEVIKHMSDNPVGVGVLFNGFVYDSRELPIYYLPWLLAITLTIPAIIMGITGIFISLVNTIKNRKITQSYIFGVWFFLPLLYVLVFRPAMYDNYRHFLFIIPAFFYFVAVGTDWCLKFLHSFKILKTLFVISIIAPGILGIISLHPYEYSYYNELVGNINGAAGKYEIDYWLTCYKELTQEINMNEKKAENLYVSYMPSLVEYYADQRFLVFKANDPEYPPDSLVILPRRRDAIQLFNEYPLAYKVEKKGVPLCLARRIE